MEIKKATIDYVKQFSKDWKQSDVEVFGTELGSEFYRAFKGKKDTVVFVGVDSGKMAGYVGGSIRGGVAHMSHLLVRRGYRKRGVAKALVEKFEEKSKEGGCHKITLRTTEKHSLLDFYRRLGFKKEGTFKDDELHLNWYQFCKFL